MKKEALLYMVGGFVTGCIVTGLFWGPSAADDEPAAAVDESGDEQQDDEFRSHAGFDDEADEDEPDESELELDEVEPVEEAELALDEPLEGELRPPEEAPHEYDTAFFSFEAGEGQTVRFVVEATDPDGLQPAIGVARTVREGQEWEEIDHARSEEPYVELTHTFDVAGEYIVTVDDQRHIPAPEQQGDMPDTFYGGDGYAFRLLAQATEDAVASGTERERE